MSLILPGAPQFSRYESNIVATPSISAEGTSVSHYVTTAHTKNPTWTQLVASTAFDTDLVLICVGSNAVSNGDSSTLLDIGIGAASAETVIIPDLAAGFATSFNSGGYRHFIFPLRIPAGSRLAARTQSVRTTGSVDVLVQLYGGPRDPDRWWSGSQVTAYGADLTKSCGTVFTPGNTGAEGTGVSLGTTTADSDCLVLGVQGHPNDVAWSTVAYHFDVGLDSASTEWIESDRYYALASSAEWIIGGGTVWWPIFRPVPSGSVLMVRGECSTTADPSVLSAIIYGVS